MKDLFTKFIKDKLNFLAAKAQRGEFVSFDYKKDNGESSRRTIRIGIDVGGKMERDGTPVSGKGNWHKELDFGLRGCMLEKDGVYYVRGTDVDSGQMRIFKLKNISNLK